MRSNFPASAFIVLTSDPASLTEEISCCPAGIHPDLQLGDQLVEHRRVLVLESLKPFIQLR